ncbi:MULTISPECIES: GntR family transcriptional regulator [Bacillales]|uniref:GntR family transcriptional regulator n=1 Tax=Lysinibacillus louembei TaxID=1470088 RepID=A0ABZ0RV92_9BACI|nr:MULTISPECIES: GntR family transcriptional regulator [Bacillales]MCT6924976.1 GntR family transcriptional regulator [Metasolibacillus sp.]MCT6942358.1 GntR family transcriptional regulator [Metasolibacillus sp.]WPK11221.1 GntR family transcriptional regulator [Lysinibacillus louembei]
METKKLQIKKPRYQTIAEDIAAKIVEKKYIVGDKIYARSSLASQYGVSAETARRAIAVLQDLEIVEATKGSGVVITSYENAVKLIQRLEGVQTVRELQVSLQQAIDKQISDLMTMQETAKELVNRTERFRSINPFVPFQLEITEACPYLDQNLSEINFWHNTHATIIAIRKDDHLILSPGPYATLNIGNVIYFIGDDEAIVKVKDFLQI